MIPDTIDAPSELDLDRLRLLQRAGAALAVASNWEHGVAALLGACLPALGECAYVDLRHAQGVRRHVSAQLDAHAVLLGASTWQARPDGAIALCALSSGRATLHGSLNSARLDAPCDAVLHQLGVLSHLTLPLRHRGELLGALNFCHLSHQHGGADLALGQSLAALLAPHAACAQACARAHESAQALALHQERLRLATAAGRIGIWDWDLAADQIDWDDQVHALFGLAPGRFGGRLDDFAALLHPDDRQSVLERIAHARAHPELGFGAEFRCPLANGEVRWLSSWGRLFGDAGGVATRMAGATIDISEAMRNQGRLQNLNAMLEQRVVSSNTERDRIWRMSHDVLAIASLDGYLMNVNPAFGAVLGWSEDEALATPFMQLVHPEQVAELEMILGLLAHGKPVDRIDVRLRHRDGSYRWLSWTVVPEGNVLYGIGRDVTELRKQRELLLRTSEARLQLALEVGGMGAWQWDIGSDSNTWWPGMALLHGLDPQADAPSMAAYRYLIHPEDRLRVDLSLQLALANRRGHQIEYRVLWPDQSVHWVEGRSELTLDEAGAPFQMTGVCVDITQRKRTEQNLRFVAQASAELAGLPELQQSLNRLARLAVPAFADYCMVDLIDAHDRFERVALAHADPAQEAVGRELFGHVQLRGVALWPAIGAGQTVFQFADGAAGADPELRALINTLGLVSGIAVPLFARGRMLGLLTFVAAESRRVYVLDDVELAEDIGRRAAIAIDNANLYRSLQDADRRKDEFLAMLAHELRNPLAPIRAAADLLKFAIGETGVRKTSEVIARQVDHMTALVDDLLDVSRVTRGLVALERRPVDLAQVVVAAVEQVRPLIDARNHQLTLALGTPPLLVDGDEKRLVQVVANLLNNAAKFTPVRGQIALRIEPAEQQLVLHVVDNGIGMAPQLVACAFELFAQAARSPDRTQGGLGLGLALVKSLAELHGGSVRASSQGEGCGSAFEVSLPRLFPAAPGAAHAALAMPVPGSLRSLRVMIVDDNVDAADTLGLLLQSSGHQTEVCNHALGALAHLAGQHYDVCLLDIGLPDIDGNELARRIRQQTSAPLLIAVTGYGQEQDRMAALAAGFDHYLVKPFDTARLLGLLQAIAAAPPAS